LPSHIGEERQVARRSRAPDPTGRRMAAGFRLTARSSPAIGQSCIRRTLAELPGGSGADPGARRAQVVRGRRVTSSPQPDWRLRTSANGLGAQLWPDIQAGTVRLHARSCRAVPADRSRGSTHGINGRGGGTKPERGLVVCR
jgi:hypothetical protein